MSRKRHTLDTQTAKKSPTKKRRKPPAAIKAKRFHIRMRDWVFKSGEIAAKQQNRSLASLIETLLILHLRENDLIPEDVDIELRQLELRKEGSLERAIRRHIK